MTATNVLTSYTDKCHDADGKPTAKVSQYYSRYIPL